MIFLGNLLSLQMFLLHLQLVLMFNKMLIQYIFKMFNGLIFMINKLIHIVQHQLQWALYHLCGYSEFSWIALKLCTKVTLFERIQKRAVHHSSEDIPRRPPDDPGQSSSNPVYSRWVSGKHINNVDLIYCRIQLLLFYHSDILNFYSDFQNNSYKVLNKLRNIKNNLTMINKVKETHWPSI